MIKKASMLLLKHLRSHYSLPLRYHHIPSILSAIAIILSLPLGLLFLQQSQNSKLPGSNLIINTSAQEEVLLPLAEQATEDILTGVGDRSGATAVGDFFGDEVVTTASDSTLNDAASTTLSEDVSSGAIEGAPKVLKEGKMYRLFIKNPGQLLSRLKPIGQSIMDSSERGSVRIFNSTNEGGEFQAANMGDSLIAEEEPAGAVTNAVQSDNSPLTYVKNGWNWWKKFNDGLRSDIKVAGLKAVKYLKPIRNYVVIPGAIGFGAWEIEETFGWRSDLGNYFFGPGIKRVPVPYNEGSTNTGNGGSQCASHQGIGLCTVIGSSDGSPTPTPTKTGFINFFISKLLNLTNQSYADSSPNKEIYIECNVGPCAGIVYVYNPSGNKYEAIADTLPKGYNHQLIDSHKKYQQSCGHITPINGRERCVTFNDSNIAYMGDLEPHNPLHYDVPLKFVVPYNVKDDQILVSTVNGNGLYYNRASKKYGYLSNADGVLIDRDHSSPFISFCFDPVTKIIGHQIFPGQNGKFQSGGFGELTNIGYAVCVPRDPKNYAACMSGAGFSSIQYFQVHDQVCSTNGAIFSKDGQSCSSDNQCPADLACENHKCMAPSRTRLPSEYCTNNNECLSKLCIKSTNLYHSECSPYKSLGQYQECTATPECRRNLVCQKDLQARGNKKYCLPPAQSSGYGDICGESMNQCKKPYVCSFDSSLKISSLSIQAQLTAASGNICLNKVKSISNGGKCISDNECKSNSCSFSNAKDNSGVCQAPKGNNAYCRSDFECKSLNCKQTYNSKTGSVTGSCSDKLENGQACIQNGVGVSGDNECKSNICYLASMPNFPEDARQVCIAPHSISNGGICKRNAVCRSNNCVISKQNQYGKYGYCQAK